MQNITPNITSFSNGYNNLGNSPISPFNQISNIRIDFSQSFK